VSVVRFLRLAIAALAVLAFYLAGLEIGQRYIARHRQLREIRSALRSLETEIVYGRSVLEEACRRLARQRLGAGSLLMGWMAEGLAAGFPASDSWLLALERAASSLALEDEDLRVLAMLAGTLGQSDRPDQSAHLTMLRETLAEREQDAARAAQRNGRMWAYLGLLAGLGLVLLVY
jgi:stage III sporulation protein AB